MPLTSLSFLAFVAAVAIGHRLAPRALRVPLLLGASYLWYGMAEWPFLALLVASVVVNLGVAFFPKIVAGPIERFAAFSRQLEPDFALSPDAWARALHLYADLLHKIETALGSPEGTAP